MFYLAFLYLRSQRFRVHLLEFYQSDSLCSLR
nr:MAG TPA: hypothetical protein [Caudoviricetes sp.]